MNYDHKLLGDLKGREFGYNDALVAQNRLTAFFEEDIDLATRLSPRIPLRIPIKSASMDTVTESRLAIALALEGGIGAVHYNFGEKIEENIRRQCEEVKKVKRYRNGFIQSPITLPPEDLIDRAIEIRDKQGISTIPITSNGQPNGSLVGIIAKDDYSRLRHRGRTIREQMVKEVYAATWSELEGKSKKPLDVAYDILLERHLSVLPIVDKDKNLMYLVTRSDIEKMENFPLATMDDQGRLRVLAAIETRFEKAMARMEALAPYVDGFLIDTAHAFFKPIEDIVREAKLKFKDHDMIVGNVSEPDAVRWLIDIGADAIRIGNGPGGGCKTWDAAGTGREQLSAVIDCCANGREYAKQKGRTVCFNADGGIEYSGDIVSALAGFADTVTLGSFLAGTDEAPGEVYQNEKGQTVKKYRGMGSAEAMNVGGAVRYGVDKSRRRVPEGGVKEVPYRGTAKEHIRNIVQGVRQGLFKAGCRIIEEMHQHAQLRPANKLDKRERAKFIDR